MHEFPVRNPDQLPALLQSFRKAAGLTQAETALRLGVTQQTYSALERHASKVSAERLLLLLNLLGVEVVLHAKPTSNTGTGVRAAEPPADPADHHGPAW
ncbi:XRE family transcriptional regulator [Aquabacterium lacunae]|uniref:XRE family transcriptional regulator n=1 Tax=Aquabacterium lacunae TaxID=2528630 RepID=A0A4Q9GZW4_9BURK|nr:helix-turn-helix transcriptional regulator [Aquabacterium lacunae]TBO30405.1 XRE family transcriptional regulator [Aquabacterium lacunae]